MDKIELKGVGYKNRLLYKRVCFDPVSNVYSQQGVLRNFFPKHGPTYS